MKEKDNSIDKYDLMPFIALIHHISKNKLKYSIKNLPAGTIPANNSLQCLPCKVNSFLRDSAGYHKDAELFLATKQCSM